MNFARDFGRIEKFIEAANAADRLKMFFVEVPKDDILADFAVFVKTECVARAKHLEHLKSRIVNEFLDARNTLSLEISGAPMAEEIESLFKSVQTFTRILSPNK